MFILLKKLNEGVFMSELERIIRENVKKLEEAVKKIKRKSKFTKNFPSVCKTRLRCCHVSVGRRWKKRVAISIK